MRFGSSISILDFVYLGSTMSLRNFGRLSSTLSVLGLARFGSSVPRFIFKPPKFIRGIDAPAADISLCFCVVCAYFEN